MIPFSLVAVGKLREPLWQAAQTTYLERLRPYAKCTVTEVVPEPTSPSVTAQQSRALEGQRITKTLRADHHVIALDAGGKTMDSVAFAQFLQKMDASGMPATFIIGGSEGIAPEVRACCTTTLSLSPLTFPHEMARIVLLEQLYRAMTILAGKTYHK